MVFNLEKRRRYTTLSFICLGVTIVTFFIIFLLGNYASTMKSEQYSNSGIVGYTLFSIVIVTPILGVILGFKGEKGLFKIIAIFANTGALMTLSLFVGAMAFYDMLNELLAK